jgi:hypothetical protein
MVLAASAWLLGCTGDEISTAARPPRAASVFTRIMISTYNGSTTVHVGDTLPMFVDAFDQFGKSMSVDTTILALSDSTVASIVIAPADPWDYGEGPSIIGAKPGEVVLTARATLGGVSRSSTKSITILATDGSS